MARALVRAPRLLLLDEPTNGLDPASETAFLELIAERRKRRGLAVVFIIHRLELVERYATHVALFVAGRVAAGPKSELYSPAALAETFGASCAAGQRVEIRRAE